MNDPTPLERYCMVEQAKGTSRRRAFLECPIEILEPIRSLDGFLYHWERVRSWRVAVAS